MNNDENNLLYDSTQNDSTSNFTNRNVDNISYVLNAIDYTKVKKLLEREDDSIVFNKIRKAYQKLSIELRGDISVIRAVLKTTDDFSLTENFVKAIPDEELKRDLIDQLRFDINSYGVRFLAVKDIVVKAVDCYALRQALTDKVNEGEARVSRPKI